MSRIVVIDLFCGCGGTTRGFMNAGLSVQKGIDIDSRCAQSYEQNNKGSIFQTADIFKVTANDVLQGVHLNRRKDKLLLSACAPCQPFSKHFKNGGRDNRRSLIVKFGKLVEEIIPDYVFVENVPGLQKVDKNSPFQKFIRSLESLDYGYEFQVIDAKDYGVPQTRNRLILIASLKGNIEFPATTHGQGHGLKPHNTVKTALKRFHPLKAGQASTSIPNHIARKLSPLNLERIMKTPKNGGDRRDWPNKLWLDCHSDNYIGHTDVYGRMKWDEPAPALTGRCTSLSNGRYGHPTQHRAITLREAAALQTFPDKYEFKGSIAHITEQIGNAVPVKLAEVFGRTFLNHAKKRSISRGRK